MSLSIILKSFGTTGMTFCREAMNRKHGPSGFSVGQDWQWFPDFGNETVRMNGVYPACELAWNANDIQ